MDSILQYFQRQQWASSSARLQALPGDASSRQYFRLVDDAKSKSFIVMKNAVEAFKSEEASATGHSNSVVEEIDFVRIGRKWKEIGIHVPVIFHVSEDHQLVLLEDLGDELLYLKRQKEDALSFYKRAIDQMILIQSSQAFHPISDRSFAESLLKWELHHFREWAEEKRRIQFSLESQSGLKVLFERIIKKMTEAEFVVVHRDFHSKNIMIHNNEIYLIDFQDALMGPMTYDLASLLRDSYVQFTDDEEAKLLSYFIEKSPRKWDQELFELNSLQRNLKAVGRFFYISLVKGKDTHLPYVNPTMQRIFHTLENLGLKKLGHELVEKIHVG